MKGNILIGFLLSFFLFVPIERIFALKREQKIFRKGWTTDVVHFFFNHFLVQVGLMVLLFSAAILLKPFINPGLQAAVVRQPHWLQFFEALVVAEFFHYLAHRMTHEISWLWKLHSIHHSIEEMDWLASARLHPLDQIFTRIISIIPLYVLGFSKATFGAFLAFAVLYSLFLHANVRFRFGFLRRVVATPQFHHWHHAAEREAYDKNFAGLLPIFDIIFGTFYMPEGRVPEKYGIKDPVPAGYLKQLRFPFQG